MKRLRIRLFLMTLGLLLLPLGNESVVAQSSSVGTQIVEHPRELKFPKLDYVLLRLRTIAKS